jgi:predicted ATP-dependent endonuclease of OLD family
MRFIRAIRITDFRSLPQVEINAVDHVMPIVGPNGSGKSNMLRALNLFFNGEVENDMPLDLGRDFHDPGSSARKRKQVEVELGNVARRTTPLGNRAVRGSPCGSACNPSAAQGGEAAGVGNDAASP